MWFFGERTNLFQREFFLPLEAFLQCIRKRSKKLLFLCVAKIFCTKVAHKNSLWISLKEIFFYHARA